MRRLSTLSAVIIGGLVVAGCGGEATEEASDTSTEMAAATSDAPESAIS